MKYVSALLLCAAIAALTAHAEVVGIVDAGDGDILELHDTVSPLCVPNTLQAIYRPAEKGQHLMLGCWTSIRGGFAVEFDRGVVVRIPTSAVKIPVRI